MKTAILYYAKNCPNFLSIGIQQQFYHVKFHVDTDYLFGLLP